MPERTLLISCCTTGPSGTVVRSSHALLRPDETHADGLVDGRVGSFEAHPRLAGIAVYGHELPVFDLHEVTALVVAPNCRVVGWVLMALGPVERLDEPVVGPVRERVQVRNHAGL